MDATDDALIDPLLLDALLRAAEPMTVEAMALGRGVDARRILTELDRLRGAGCTFDEHPQHGVSLREAGLSAWSDYLRHVLGDGRPIAVYRSIASTQDACRRLVAAHAPQGDGTIVAAHEQTAGRGRFGRTWLAPPGATVTFSRACRVDDTLGSATVDRLTFAASVAIASAVESLIGQRRRVQIKWPNDVCIDGRKVAGILVETCELASTSRAAILGVGLNISLNPADLARADPLLPRRVTSLASHGAAVDRLLALARAAAALDDALERCDEATLLAQWRARCAQLEQPIQVRCDGRAIRGRAIDLDPREGLIVRTDSGEIVHLPAARATVV